jgi:JAB1/Mov34/MPN/PAD-1 ubiquitin protease
MPSQPAVSTTASAPALLLEEDADVVTHLVVHPLVLLHVLDHHTRRQEANGRVIGTLLGRRDGNKVRDICIFVLFDCVT